MARRMTEKRIRQMLKNHSRAWVLRHLCGNRIGSGFSRDVYEFKGDLRWVVKIERDMDALMFCNVTEFRNWANYQYWDFLSSYLAKCVAITQDGGAMVQERAEYRRTKEYPKMIPVFFTDTKYANFGWAGDRFVCMDYAFMPVAVVREGRNSMKVAKWWGARDLNFKRK